MDKLLKKCEVCGKNIGVRPVKCSSFNGNLSIRFLCKVCEMKEKLKKY